MNSTARMSHTRFPRSAKVVIASVAAALALAATGGAVRAEGDAAEMEHQPMHRVIITRVLPNPSAGPERVELLNEGPVYRVFVPVLMNRSGGPEWSVGDPPSPPLPDAPVSEVGLPPAPPPDPAGLQASALPETVAPADMRGWQLGSDTAGWYAFPDDMPPIPTGTRIVVIFDGAGAAANDYDAADGEIELHTQAGLVNVLDDAAGRIALYSSPARSLQTLKSSMMWAVAAR
jgi:hypothetical protein